MPWGVSVKGLVGDLAAGAVMPPRRTVAGPPERIAHRVGNPMVGVGVGVIAYPAIEALIGQVTVNSWTSDATVVIAAR